ncbi:hypothetical protein PSO31014_04357 [Pandoraea soli]|uniref:Uncharacterized protein n=1 Tax=Pandoraea soli TaxID=2508293 RepID=A0ABY6WA56_9BURK|nr:hypothetical protein PSO31014_04357 [Pandoraea soli]
MRLNRAFSSSSCFSRRSSETPRSPYFFFQLMGWTARQGFKFARNL